MKDKKSIRVIKMLLVMKLATTLLIALTLLLVYGNQQAVSALLGGLVALLPTAFFARKLFQHQGARAAREIIKSFYLGEALKILISMVLFTLVFMFYEVKPLTFFVTYIVVVMNYWFTPLIIDNKHNRPESD